MAKDQSSNATGNPADAMRQASERMQAAGSGMAQSGSELGMKVLEQAEQNTQEAFRAMRAAASASDLSEVMRIQAEFMREQSSRSVTQAREIGEMIAGFGRAAVNQMSGKSDS